MKKIDLGQTIAILANIGVFLGILLLVYELNQNRELAAAQIRNEIAQASAEIMRGEAQDAELLDVSMRGIAGEPLTPLELERFQLYWLSYFQLWQNAHFQYRAGLYDEREYESQRTAWARLLARPGIRMLWCSPRGVGEKPADFASEVNSLLREPCE